MVKTRERELRATRVLADGRDRALSEAALVSETVYELAVGTARYLIRATAKRILPPNSCHTERSCRPFGTGWLRTVRCSIKLRRV